MAELWLQLQQLSDQHVIMSEDWYFTKYASIYCNKYKRHIVILEIHLRWGLSRGVQP